MAETSPSPVSYDFVTRAIARTLGNPGKGYYALLALAVALLGVGIVCLLFLLRYGLGLAGYSHPVYWAVYITCFVFWVGIAHSGTLISAILFLFRSGWRTAVYRTAEAMTVFAVMTAGLFPLIHIGRQWYFYWLIPYPNERGLWPNFKSPLIWDEFAIRTLFHLEDIITIHHFENLAKLCLLTGLIVSMSYCTENFTAWFGGNPHERAAFWYRAFGPFWWASWTMNICNGLLPWLLWSKKVRTSVIALFVVSIFVNIGMWFERFVIIVVSLAGEPFERFANAAYNPTWADWGIMAGSFGWFFMWFLLFVKNFPAVSISEVKEVLPAPQRGRGVHA